MRRLFFVAMLAVGCDAGSEAPIDSGAGASGSAGSGASGGGAGDRLASRSRDAVAKAVTGSSRGDGPSKTSTRATAREQPELETPASRASGPAGLTIAEKSGITTWEWDELPAHVDGEYYARTRFEI